MGQMAYLETIGGKVCTQHCIHATQYTCFWVCDHLCSVCGVCDTYCACAGFKRRNSIVLRKSRKLTTDRAKQSKPEIIMEFYDKLKKAYDEYKFSPDQIYNMDEKGVCIMCVCMCVGMCIYVYVCVHVCAIRIRWSIHIQEKRRGRGY